MAYAEHQVGDYIIPQKYNEVKKYNGFFILD